MRVEIICPKCNKHKGVKNSLRTKDNILHILECGHFYTEDLVITAEETARKAVETSSDNRWNELFDYQKTGVLAIERSNFRFICGDEMGLGKTIQAIYTLRRNFDKLTPTLIIVPASLVYKWQRELKKWLNDKYNGPQNAPMVHLNSNGEFLEGQNIHIISNAIVGKKEVIDSIKSYGFKLVIVDECHQFKNDGANRTKALIEVSSLIPFKIMLSGTNVINRTDEYFNALHVVRPEHWPHKGYLQSYCVVDRKGKILGLSDTRRQLFFERTKEYVIRRKKDEVLKDLPEKQINSEFILVNDNLQFVQSYNKQLDELAKAVRDYKNKLNSDVSFMQIIAIMSRLRHITGLAKVPFIIDKVTEFLENTDGEKIAIGVHHKMVAEFLKQGLEKFNPIMISSESAKVKDEKEEEFRSDPEKRLAILSILGTGQGRDMQFCTNVIVAEPEWSPAIEMQFHDRFHRIGTKQAVIIDYVLAEHTIDEFMEELKKLKSHVVNSVLDADFSSNQQLMLDLADKVLKMRMKYVG